MKNNSTGVHTLSFGIYKLSEELVSEIRQSPLLIASLHHRSANVEASKILETIDIMIEVLDIWQRAGDAVINLWSAETAISDPKNRTAGAASIASRRIFEAYVTTIGLAIFESNLAVLGAGVTRAEKDASKIYDQLALQLVGALVTSHGLAHSRSRIFDHTLKSIPVTTEAIKDEKTHLQEITQKQKLGLPQYVTLGTTGKGSKQTFKVEVRVKDEKALGTGTSRRAAEKAAATAFLEKFLPPKRISAARSTSSFDIPLAANSVPERSNLAEAITLATQLKLPPWAARLISLAFTHASFSDHGGRSALGKDNKLLAFIGSYVLTWVVRDCCVCTVPTRDIVFGGGLINVTTPTLQMNVLATVFDSAGLEKLALLGDGEPILMPQIKAELLQALVGALFLAYPSSQILRWSDLFSGVSALADFLQNQIANLPKTRELLLPPKNLFQERCQAIGISAAYTTQISKNDKLVTLRPMLRLHSKLLDSRAVLTLDMGQTAENLARRKVEHEAELANLALKAFAEVSGLAMNNNSVDTAEIIHVKQWLLLHTIAVANEIAEGRGKRKRPRRVDHILGIKILQERNFPLFSQWLESSITLLSFEHFNTDTLANFYAHIGITESLSKVQRNLTKSLRELRVLIETADPLNHDTDLRENPIFDSTVIHATIYRIIGSPIAKITLLDLASQAQLLLHKRGINVNVDKNSTQELQEVRGAHLALIALVTSEQIFPSCSKLSFDINEEALVIVASSIDESLPLSTLTESPLWQALEVILPVLQVSWDECAFRVRIPCVSGQGTRDLALRFWLNYNLKGALGTAANDTVATMLHDMKNSLLGFASASRTARSVSIVRERYQLAHGAVEHLNQALSTLNAAEAFLRSTTKLPLHEIKLSYFMRTLVTNLMSWLPRNVSLILPERTEDGEIWSNQDRLNSILLNLCRNSADAMSDDGKLTLRARLNSARDAVEFEVADTGSGFTDTQLSSLNEGIPIKSTKTKGQGIGLLTVLLLVEELGGTISFENIEGGSRTLIWIPTTFPQLND